MNKLDRAKSLIKNNGVCMFEHLPCSGCPKKISLYCDSNIGNFTSSEIFKTRKKLAEKYLEKKRNIKTTFNDLKKGDYFNYLERLEESYIYIKIDNNFAIDIKSGHILKTYQPEKIFVKKIKIKIEEIE